MDEVAIRVTDLSKTFKLPHEKQGSVKNIFVNLFRGRTTYEKQKVLNDISFEVKKGEFFGIVGRNGSGKSTLLKLLAGIYLPNKGTIQVNGKLTPFIELGVGFNPELTGRENVYLNGALLGFSREEMNKMYGDIVEFAELEKFMDLKLKNYSSGMQVRLAFSVAIRARTEILLIDEVLAVGDEAFQAKCYEYFYDLKAQNKTVILVSHDMEAVKKFCDRAMLVETSNKILEGEPQKAAFEYMKRNFPDLAVDSARGKILKKLELKNSKNETTNSFLSGEKIIVNVAWKQNPKIKNVGLALVKNDGTYVFGTNTIIDEVGLKSNNISYELDSELGPGQYHFQLGLFGETDREKILYIDQAAAINISGSGQWQGIYFIKHSWRP